MSELLGITVADLVRVLKQRKVRIPSEIGAFIALEIAEALIDGPAAPSASDIRLAEDGTIGVFAPPGSATSERGARAVVGILGSLLVAAGTGVPKVLVTLLERGPSSGRWDLPSLRDDLEASLVPLNRAAARRILARMLREAARAREAMDFIEPAPREQSLDAQLDDLLGGSLSEPPPDPSVRRAPPRAAPPARPASIPAPDLDDLDDLDRELDATLNELSAPHSRPASRSEPPGDPFAPPSRTSSTARGFAANDVAIDVAGRASAGAGSAVDDEATVAEDSPRLLAEAESHAKAKRERTVTKSGLSDEDLNQLAALDAPKRTSVMPWLLAMLAIAAATAATLALMRPDLVDALLGRPPPPEAPAGPTQEDRDRMMREHLAQFGTLSLSVQPAQAQVLMFVGRGPAVAEEFPLGMALEFVAIADGRVPTRAVVPPDATWEEPEEEDGRRRYELAMQTGDEEMAAEALALGDTRLTQDVGAPSGELGNVRIVTNPPGAKVYVLVGFSPTVTVENMRTDDAVELLVYHEGYPVMRHVITPSDWVQAADGSKTAEAELVLEGYDPDDPPD